MLISLIALGVYHAAARKQRPKMCLCSRKRFRQVKGLQQAPTSIQNQGFDMADSVAGILCLFKN